MSECEKCRNELNDWDGFEALAGLILQRTDGVPHDGEGVYKKSVKHVQTCESCRSWLEGRRVVQFQEKLHEKINDQIAKSERKAWIWFGFISIFLVAAAFLFGPQIIHPDARYESSDRKWSAFENYSKGLGYDSIVYAFENYKRRCQVNNVYLVRVTKRNAWNIFAWPSYLFHPKWKVEYSEPTASAQYTGFVSC